MGVLRADSRNTGLKFLAGNDGGIAHAGAVIVDGGVGIAQEAGYGGRLRYAQ